MFKYTLVKTNVHVCVFQTHLLTENDISSGRNLFPRVWSCYASDMCKSRFCLVQVCKRQECIPVGCVPSAAVAVSPGGVLPQCILGYQPPWDQAHPLPPEQAHPPIHRTRHPPEQTPPLGPGTPSPVDRQTSVKA